MCKRMEDDDHEASRFNMNITDIKVTKVLLNTNIIFFIFIANIMIINLFLTSCRFITDPIHGEIEVPAVCQGEYP